MWFKRRAKGSAPASADAKQDKKQAKAERKQKKRNKKKKQTVKLVDKEVLFPDIKLYRVMPIVLAISLLMIIGGYGLIFKDNHDYKVAQSRVSMPKGTSLPLLQGKTQAKLTMGNAILSKDGRDMAVEIDYDQAAFGTMSTFGYKYKLFLLTMPNYPSQNIEVKYGFFSTDGNGVLQIHSKKGPLKNQSFLVALWDRSGLSDTTQLGTTTSTTDDDVNKSITAQLANGDSSSDSSTNANQGMETSGSSKPPIFYLRLNPVTAKRVDTNWGNNNRKLVELLFVNDNLAKIRKQVGQLKKERKQVKTNLDEMDQRLKKNPNDDLAQQQKSTLEGQLTEIDSRVQKAEANYKRISKARFGNNILGKQQTHHTTEKSSNVESYGNSGKGS